MRTQRQQTVEQIRAATAGPARGRLRQGASSRRNTHQHSASSGQTTCAAADAGVLHALEEGRGARAVGARHEAAPQPQLKASHPALQPPQASLTLDRLEVVHNGDAQAGDGVQDSQHHHVQAEGAEQGLRCRRAHNWQVVKRRGGTGWSAQTGPATYNSQLFMDCQPHPVPVHHLSASPLQWQQLARPPGQRDAEPVQDPLMPSLRPHMPPPVQDAPGPPTRAAQCRSCPGRSCPPSRSASASAAALRMGSERGRGSICLSQLCLGAWGMMCAAGRGAVAAYARRPCHQCTSITSTHPRRCRRRRSQAPSQPDARDKGVKHPHECTSSQTPTRVDVGNEGAKDGQQRHDGEVVACGGRDCSCSRHHVPCSEPSSAWLAGESWPARHVDVVDAAEYVGGLCMLGVGSMHRLADMLQPNHPKRTCPQVQDGRHADAAQQQDPDLSNDLALADAACTAGDVRDV